MCFVLLYGRWLIESSVMMTVLTLNFPHLSSSMVREVIGCCNTMTASSHNISPVELVINVKVVANFETFIVFKESIAI